MTKNKKTLTEQERKDKILERLQNKNPIIIYDEKYKNRYTYVKNSFFGDYVLKQSTLTIDKAIDEILDTYNSKIQTTRKFKKSCRK